MPTLVTPGELSRWLGLSIDGVAAAEEAGRLPRARRTPGNHRRWLAADVVAFLSRTGATIPPELVARATEDGS